MNLDAFEGLSKKDQEAIMRVSGEKLSRLAGAAWGKADENGILEAKSNGVNVVFLTEDDQRVKDLNSLTKGIDQLWIDSVESRDVDATGGLAAFRKYVNEINSEK
jgi:TRAP-type C4-dicarboxylate transport system substrate-binding protein